MPNDDDDLFDDDDDDLDDLDTQQKLDRLHKQLRLEKKNSKELAKQLEEGTEAKRKLAVMEAKLPESPQVKFFLDNYQGPLDADSIRSKAAEYGFIEADKKAEEEAQQVTTMMAAGVGAGAPPGPGSDAELMDKINKVPPGEGSAKKIKDLMIQYGRYVPDED